MAALTDVYGAEDAARESLAATVGRLMAAETTKDTAAAMLHRNAQRCAGEEAAVLKCYSAADVAAANMGRDGAVSYLDCAEAVKLYSACAKAAAPK